jgi:Bifunctional DNA primase/polymerase, N-terminal
VPRNPHDPNPHFSILDDAQTKRQIAAQAERALAMVDRYRDISFSNEQLERERWQWESNALAEKHPLYAVARSAAVHHAIVPLQPLGVEPLVSPSKATKDEKTILEWWSEWPKANVGVPVGRANNVIAVHLQDVQAIERLDRLMSIERQGKQNNDGSFETYIEHRDLHAASLRFVSTKGVSMRSVVGWERDLDRQVYELWQENRPYTPDFLLWSYPPIQSGLDAFDFLSRRIVTGVQLLGPDEVVPWTGSRFEMDLMLSGPSGPLPEIPVWLAKVIGKPRSRKVMRAAREAFEAAQRASYGISDAEALKLIAAREMAQAEAGANVKRTREALAKVEKDEPKDELPPVLPDEEEPKPRPVGTWG